MKRGSVCSTHNEFSPDGECRWCEPPPSEVPTLGAMLPAIMEHHARLGLGAVPLQQQYAQQGLGASLPDPNIGPPRNQQPPLQVASCKHDGALLDFSGTISCAACGKVISARPTIRNLHSGTCASINDPRVPCDCSHLIIQ